jgi:hypothetical protein
MSRLFINVNVPSIHQQRIVVKREMPMPRASHCRKPGLLPEQQLCRYRQAGLTPNALTYNNIITLAFTYA